MTRSLVSIIAALAVLVPAWLPSPSSAQELVCSPVALGVPGQREPPPFFTEPLTADSYDDARWRGAAGRSLHEGHASLRTLSYEEGGEQHLLLSWRITSDDGAYEDTDEVNVGLWNGAGGTAYRLRFRRGNAASLPAPPAYGPADPIDVRCGPESEERRIRGLSDTDIVPVTVERWDGGGWVAVPGPASWVQARLEATYYYCDPTTSAGDEAWRTRDWTMQVDLRLEGAGGTPEIDDSGRYRLFTRVDWQRAPGATMSAGPATWPPTTGTAIPIPLPSQWGSAALGTTDADCPEGVTIERSLISVNSGSHLIRVPRLTSPSTTEVTNNFLAEPRNTTSSPLPASAVRARFRIANWGTGVGDSPRWDTIADCGDQPSGTGAGAGGTFSIPCEWTTSWTDTCSYIDDSHPNCAGLLPPPQMRHQHQCVLVELMGGQDVTFVRDSAYRNMDFIQASRFERLSTVDVGARGERDVYLNVVTRNMRPEDPDAGDPYSTPSLEEILQVRDRYRASQTGLDVFDELKRRVPTYEVYAMLDTGDRVTDEDGDERMVLEGMPSFGFFVGHDGQILGWQHALEGAEQIAPNLYRVRTNADGWANVRVVIETIDQPNTPPLALDGDVPQPPCFDNDGCADAPPQPPEDPPEVEPSERMNPWAIICPALIFLILVLLLLYFGLGRRR